MKGQEHLSYEERLRELGLSTCRREGSAGDLIHVYKHLTVNLWNCGIVLIPSCLLFPECMSLFV